MKKIFAAMAFAAVLAVSSFASAQSPALLSNEASECEIFRAISKVIPAECAPGYKGDEQLTRSIVRRDGKQINAEPVVQDKESNELSAAFLIQFDYDSDVLTDEAKLTLDRLAVVLSNELVGNVPFLIEGHADRSGNDEYNQDLSQRRAISVGTYLVDKHGIDSIRLRTVGFGASRLLDPNNPYSAINRRVEFKNLGE